MNMNLSYINWLMMKFEKIVLNSKTAFDTENKEIVESKKWILLYNVVQTPGKVIKRLEERNFVTDEEIMFVYKIKEKILSQKPKRRQLNLRTLFSKLK